jgi:hypothetical protein
LLISEVVSTVVVVKGEHPWAIIKDILDAEAGCPRSSQPMKQVMISEAFVSGNSKENRKND